MTKDELLKIFDLATMQHTDYGYETLRSKVQEIAREALAQTQEPVAWWVTSPDGEIDWSDEPIQYKEQRPLEELVDGCGYAPLYTSPPQRTWVGLMRGVRVDGDTVVITVKGGNDAARELCGELLKEKNT